MTWITAAGIALAAILVRVLIDASINRRVDRDMKARGWHRIDGGHLGEIWCPPVPTRPTVKGTADDGPKDVAPDKD